MLALMRYKDFIWPNNPASCQWGMQRTVVRYQYPGGDYLLEDLGVKTRVFTGSGVFFGKYAYDNMKKLTEVFSREGSGTLYHPVIRFRQAYFTELEFLEEPRENYVTYRFRFQEDGGEQGLEKQVADEGTKYHLVLPGQTLWDVAAEHGVSAEYLLLKNLWIENPNQLTGGRRVVIW